MPIRIDDEKNNRPAIVFLCDDEWTISPQLYELDRWLKDVGKELEPGEYVADIGIHCIDPSASGGGGVLSIA